jgi:NAD-dependent dihydropyrimidine dehydrogenase PreA subunit
VRNLPPAAVIKGSSKNLLRVALADMACIACGQCTLVCLTGALV